MTARNRDTSFSADRCATLEDPGNLFRLQLVDRHTQDRKRHDRLSAHGIDIGNGVGGGDAAKIVGVVHHRHEEVCGGDHACIVVDLPDSGVVGHLVSDQKLCERLRGRLACQQFLQDGGCKLAAATAAMGKLGQTGRRHIHGIPPSERAADCGSCDMGYGGDNALITARLSR
ncbi:hypothetical protein D3C71_679940 [compost metagenome]